MHHRLIMVTARDLKWQDKSKKMVLVGPDTARVCRAALRQFARMKDAYLVSAAGHSPKYNGELMSSIMRNFLLKGTGPVDIDRVIALLAKEFNTNGEMAALTRFMREGLRQSPEDTFEIWLAASWWHWPRARVLLHARLEPWQRRQTKVHAVLAPSWSRAMFLEPLAWAKNIWNKNVFWWRHDTFTLA